MHQLYILGRTSLFGFSLRVVQHLRNFVTGRDTAARNGKVRRMW